MSSIYSKLYVHFLLLLAMGLVSPSGLASSCSNLFEAVVLDFKINKNGSITFNHDFEGIGGRAQVYPADMTLHNLNLKRSDFKTTPSSPVIMLGEGYSPLLNELLIKERPVISVDPIYQLQTRFEKGFMSQYLTEFMKKHGTSPSLVPKSADNTSLPSNKYRLVVGHMLLNNFPRPTDDRYYGTPAINMVIEALRISKPGGKIIFAHMSEGGKEFELLLMKEVIEKIKTLSLGYKFSYAIHAHKTTLDYKEFAEFAQDKLGTPLRETTLVRIEIIKEE